MAVGTPIDNLAVARNQRDRTQIATGIGRRPHEIIQAFQPDVGNPFRNSGGRGQCSRSLRQQCRLAETQGNKADEDNGQSHESEPMHMRRVGIILSLDVPLSMQIIRRRRKA